MLVSPALDNCRLHKSSSVVLRYTFFSRLVKKHCPCHRRPKLTIRGVLLWFFFYFYVNVQRNVTWGHLRSSKNAFIMQSKSTFLEFLSCIHRYKFGPPPKVFQGRNYSGHRARALFLTGVEFHVLPCVLLCFLVEFDLLFAFSVLSCRILDCAAVFIYVHEHDRLCFPMSTEETAVFDCIC